MNQHTNLQCPWDAHESIFGGVRAGQGNFHGLHRASNDTAVWKAMTFAMVISLSALSFTIGCAQHSGLFHGMRS